LERGMDRRKVEEEGKGCSKEKGKMRRLEEW
jgi:hypothetical protein